MNDTYDAGYLPDDENCGQDSIRVELAYSHDFYSSIIESKSERIEELEAALRWSRDSNTGHEPSLSVMQRYYDDLIPKAKALKAGE